MQVTTLIEEPQGQTMVSCGMAWYITTPSNHKAQIFLPRVGNEVRLRSVYHKLFLYTDPLILRNWEKRVVYVDEFVGIGDRVQVVMKKNIKENIKENYEEVLDANCNCNR